VIDHNLIDFIVKAKKNTYATQKGFVPSCRKGSKDLLFAEVDFEYLDSYFGARDFSGEEVVYRSGKAVWSMNYFGKMLRDNLPEGFIETLREALTLLTVDEPYRGCKCHQRGSYCYEMDVQGDVAFFHGEEWISLEGETVYRLYFHGGEVV
jgi:hypothetical protein